MSLLTKAIEGRSDMEIAIRVMRQLEKEFKDKDSFTMADVRRIRRELFETKTPSH